MTTLLTDVYAEIRNVDTRASKDACTSNLLYPGDKRANTILAAIVKHSER